MTVWRSTPTMLSFIFSRRLLDRFPVTIAFPCPEWLSPKLSVRLYSFKAPKQIRSPRLDKTSPRVDTAVVPPSSHELDDLKWGRRLNGPRSDDTVDLASTRPTSPTPRELEQSQPTTPHPDHAVDALVQSANNPPRNKWRLMSSGVFFLLLGLQDAVVRTVLKSAGSSLRIDRRGL